MLGAPPPRGAPPPAGRPLGAPPPAGMPLPAGLLPAGGAAEPAGMNGAHEVAAGEDGDEAEMAAMAAMGFPVGFASTAGVDVGDKRCKVSWMDLWRDGWMDRETDGWVEREKERDGRRGATDAAATAPCFPPHPHPTPPKPKPKPHPHPNQVEGINT